MAGLNSQRIVDHQNPDEGIAETVYEDGTRVYVNYRHEAWETDGVAVPARSYAVVKGGDAQ